LSKPVCIIAHDNPNRSDHRRDLNIDLAIPFGVAAVLHIASVRTSTSTSGVDRPVAAARR
jgi:hypothetical protein